MHGSLNLAYSEVQTVWGTYVPWSAATECVGANSHGVLSDVNMLNVKWSWGSHCCTAVVEDCNHEGEGFAASVISRAVTGITPCHTLITPCHALITPCHTLITPCHALITPCHTLITPCHALITPCHTLITPCHTLITPCHTVSHLDHNVSHPDQTVSRIVSDHTVSRAVVMLVPYACHTPSHIVKL